MQTIDNDSKYELYNKLCNGFKKCQIAWSNQNVIAVSTLVKTVDDKTTDENKKVHYIPSIHIFKEIVALDKFLDRNKTKSDLSGYSRIAKSSDFHKSEITQLSWSEDGNYLASIDKDGHFCIWESKNFINEWNYWYKEDMKKPISCFSWIHSCDKFNIDPKNEYKYVNNPIGCQNVNNVGFSILTNDGKVTIFIKNEKEMQKYNTEFSEFEMNKNKNNTITHSSCYLGDDNSLSYVTYCADSPSNYVTLYNISLDSDFTTKPIQSIQLSRLKIDTIQNINKNYKLMDIQLVNDKRMILTFGINNKNEDKDFNGYICSFELSDDMDITPDLGISFNDFLFPKKTWKFVSNFEYEKTFPIYIKIISNSFNKHVLLIQYENGNSELRDCESLKPISYYEWMFTNTIPVIDNKLIEALKNYNSKYNLRFKNNTSSSTEDTQKKQKVEGDPMDLDIKTESSFNLFSTSQPNKTPLKMEKIDDDDDDDDEYNFEDQFNSYYYYTSEIILSPNGMVSVTFEKTLDDIKFKIKEGNSIVDLFLCWENKETVKNKIGSKFNIDFYSDDHYYNIINTLVAQLVVSILNENDYEDIIYFLIKINKYYDNKNKDLIGDFLVCFFNEYNKNISLLDNDIISVFPRDENSNMSIEGQPFVLSMVFNRSFAARDIQFFNNNIFVQLNYIGQSFLNHFIYPWKINKYLDVPILKIDEEFENYCAMKKECFHYNAPLAYWIIELCKHILKHLYMWYNITYRKRNRSKFLDEEETIDEIFNQPNYLPLILFSNSRRMLIRLINYINIYGINIYVLYEQNSAMGKRQPDHEGLSYEEENYYLSEFNNILLKDKMDLNELNKMLYDIDTKLKPLEKNNDLEFQICEIKDFIYNGTIPSYLKSFVKKDLKELYNSYISKIFLSNNFMNAYTNMFSHSEISYIEREKIDHLTSGMIYQNFVGLKLYGVGFSMENTAKRFENINLEEPKKICSNLTDYQINNLSNTFFSDIVQLNEININTSPNIYNENTTYKSKVISILENNLLKQYDILTKTSLHRAVSIRQCERCFHFSEIPHLDEFGGFSLVLPNNVLNDDKKSHKKEFSKNTKKTTMPSVGGENLNSGNGLYVFRGKAAWYRKYGRNCICGGRWRKW